jgi:hypothetical protein
MRLEKGMLISVDSCWYVVVHVFFKDGRTYLYCICDHANNIYAWEVEHVHTHLSRNEIANLGYSWPDRDLGNLKDRDIPYDVIAEVLLGREDDRFDHWENHKD